MAVLEHVGQSEPLRNEHGFQIDCKLASLDELNLKYKFIWWTKELDEFRLEIMRNEFN